MRLVRFTLLNGADNECVIIVNPEKVNYLGPHIDGGTVLVLDCSSPYSPFQHVKEGWEIVRAKLIGEGGVIE